jgi:micrococcal nuclease
MKTILLLFILCSSGVILAQNEVVGKVVNVIDGNTLEVTSTDNQTQKLVLAGVDSPELGQEYGDKAKKFLEKLMMDEDVRFQVTGKDRWGNYIAIVMKGKVDPRIELLEEGLAWTSEKNPIPELEALRMKALEKGRGLWKEENPIPPWTYRRQQSMMQAKSN